MKLQMPVVKLSRLIGGGWVLIDLDSFILVYRFIIFSSKDPNFQIDCI